jgi:hypothetical protein
MQHYDSFGTADQLLQMNRAATYDAAPTKQIAAATAATYEAAPVRNQYEPAPTRN